MPLSSPIAFLHEAKGRLLDRCDAAFAEAAACYGVVHDRLKPLADMCPMPKRGWDVQTRFCSLESWGGCVEGRGISLALEGRAQRRGKRP